MKTIEIKLFSFDELSEKAQRTALESLYDINLHDDWYDGVYEDARNIGLEIREFDIDRGSCCKAIFIESAEATAHKIIDEHGDMCDTFKTATSYLYDRDVLIVSAPRDDNGDFEDEYELDQQLDELDNEFLKALSEDYLKSLRIDYEYLSSKEAIKETIEANEYDFTEDGKLY